MTRHFDPKSLQFYITVPAPCPYLPDEMERKIFTPLDPMTGSEINDYLTHSGFRRSQNVVYRPACENCRACQSLRVHAPLFKPGRSFKRTLSKNSDISREIVENLATHEQFDLLSAYLSKRHQNGGMSDMDFERFEIMVEDCASRTEIFEYRNKDGTLLACCLSDTLADGLSMVYSFFDIRQTKRSLGTYMILDHLEFCKQVGHAYLYLGYWVKSSQKMAYKARFTPYETLGGMGWQNGDYHT